MQPGKNLTKPKLIVYDWDNTLVDTSDVITRVVNRLRADEGMHSLSNSEILSSTGDPECDWVTQLFGKSSQENANKYVRYYREENCNFSPKLIPFASEILKTSWQMGIRQAVLTNKESVVAKDECLALGIVHQFITFLGKCDVEEKKPSPHGIKKAVETYEQKFASTLKPEEVWFVGDTMVDMASAGNYGCPGIYVGEESWIKRKYENSIYFKGNLMLVEKLLLSL